MTHTRRCLLASSLLALLLLSACGSDVQQSVGGSGGGGSGGGDPSACPLSSGISAHDDADAVAGQPCDGETTCTFIASCDVCEIACVEGTWQTTSCMDAGPGC